MEFVNLSKTILTPGNEVVLSEIQPCRNAEHVAEFKKKDRGKEPYNPFTKNSCKYLHLPLMFG